MAMKISEELRNLALRRFARDEGGAMIVLGLVFFTLMIMMGGLAVDLMRFEATRTQLQQTTDRAVLAAASLRQTLSAESVVRDYFDKAGLTEKLKSVEVVQSFNAKSVYVTAASKVDPFFVQMLGINELEAPAAGMAIEKITDVEISLVLDISGSMDSNNRLINLKPAAKEFITTIFQGAEPGRTTMSIIPYSGHVNLGSTMMSVFNVTKQHDMSYCVDLPSSTFTSTTISQSTPFPQAGHFDPFQSTSTRAASLFFCPKLAANTVLPMSDNVTALKAKVDGLDADGNTSIDIGMKWGVTLLDPASNPIVTSLIANNVVSATYSNRPLDPTTREVLKVIVLMTDGENTEESVLKTAFKTGDSNIYKRTSDGKLAVYFDRANTADDYYMPDNSSSTRWQSQPFSSATGWTKLTWQEVWAYASMPYVAQKLYADAQAISYSTVLASFRDTSSTATKNTRLQQICSAAKAKGYVIYAMGYEAPAAGKTELKKCVLSPGNYYDVTPALSISTAFRSIASQISNLRLTQ